MCSSEQCSCGTAAKAYLPRLFEVVGLTPSVDVAGLTPSVDVVGLTPSVDPRYYIRAILD